MKSMRLSKVWNLLALVAVVLWLAPAVAWTCPRTGFIGDSPADVMAKSGRMRCPAMAEVAPEVAPPSAAKRCAMCPEEPAARPVAPVACKGPAGKPAATGTQTDTCCLSAWVPDTRRVAQRASAEQIPVVQTVSVSLLAPAVEPGAIASFPTAERVPLQRARAGPSAPRGPPAAVA